MVQSKKKREENPVSALARLMQDPGSSYDIWDDYMGSIEREPRKRLARALVGTKRYDDRAAAIVFGAMLEQSLEIAISSRLVGTPKTISKVFSYVGDGPLATLAAKITMGEALGLYENGMRKDLSLLKQVRNAFAHARLHVDFSTDAIARACDQIQAVAGMVEKETTRQKYVGSVAMITFYLGEYPKIPQDARTKFYEEMYGLTPGWFPKS